MGPHPDPKEKGRLVFHWYEMCDAVQAESYEVHGVPVSNFVLPLYFTVDSEPGSRNDFLSSKQLDGKRLPSFGVNPGGYIGFYDPLSDKHDTYFADDVARPRAEIKSQVGFARRGIRSESVSKPLATGRVPPRRAAVSLVAQTPTRPKGRPRGRNRARHRNPSRPRSGNRKQPSRTRVQHKPRTRSRRRSISSGTRTATSPSARASISASATSSPGSRANARSRHCSRAGRNSRW